MLLETISEFLNQYNLPWLILAIISWLAIYFLCSFRVFLHALPVGIWTMFIGAILEYFFVRYEFWTERFIMIPIGGLDLFVVVGPFFTIGIILIRFLPAGKYGKLAIVFVLSLIAAGVELLAVKMGFLVYNQEKWTVLYSVVAYCLGLMSALGFYYVYYNKDLVFNKGFKR